jgi:hypothetical protein
MKQERPGKVHFRPPGLGPAGRPADHWSMPVLDRPAQVRRACRILLGTDQLRGDAVPSFDRVLLKKLYRRQAMARHPDRTGGDGQAFADLHEAWRLLDGLLESGPDAIHQAVHCAPARQPPAERASPWPPRPAPGAEPRRRARPAPRPLPAHALRLGQFLLHRGLISREELIQALVWQGQSRPPFGRIAESLGYLGAAEVAWLAQARRQGEHLGDAAVRLGLMDSYQRLVVLGWQRRYQAEIGRYFLESGCLDEAGLEEALNALRRHNLLFGSGGRVAAAAGA